MVSALTTVPGNPLLGLFRRSDSMCVYVHTQKQPENSCKMTLIVFFSLLVLNKPPVLIFAWLITSNLENLGCVFYASCYCLSVCMSTGLWCLRMADAAACGREVRCCPLVWSGRTAGLPRPAPQPHSSPHAA